MDGNNLYKVREGMIVLATILKHPSILKNSSYNLELTDFNTPLHQVLFGAVKNLHSIGVNEITPMIMEDYIKEYSEIWYKIFKENNGISIVTNDLELLADERNFDYHYNSLKKYSYARDLLKNPISLEEILINSEIDDMNFEEVKNFVNRKILSLKQKWDRTATQDRYGFKAGEGLKSLKEKLKKSPSWGYPFANPTLTGVTRGMRRKKFMLRSGSTGSGKSRQQMADACNLAIPYLYDVDRRKWVKNFSRESVLYISTELEKEEVQTCFLAYVSGVPEAHILDNMYEEGEEERVDRAIELLEESDLFVEYISDFDIDDIQNLIELYIINHDIGYAFFDYIHLAPKLMASTTKAMGTKLREDQILYLFGVVLKAMANKYNIFLQSSTQLNRGYKEDGNLDASALRGAMSLGDKLDIGIISLPVTIKELEKLEPIIKKLQDNTFGNRNNCVPTMSHTIYKNRGNKKNAIRIWTRMELDNIREKTIFVTNMDYKIIDEQLDKVAFCPPNSDLDNEILDYLNGHTNVRPEKLYVPKISKEKLQDVA